MVSFKLKDTGCFVRTNKFRGGIILLVEENIPGKIIDGHKIIHENASMKSFFLNSVFIIKIASSWDIQAPSQSDEVFLNELQLAMAKFNNTYESFLVIGDFNMTPENKNMIDFLNTSCFENLIKEPTCFKSAIPSCVALILSNKKSLFMRSETFENDLSDFHKVTTAILRKTIAKGNPKTILYRDYKLFDQNRLNEELNPKMKKKRKTLTFQHFKIFL